MSSVISAVDLKIGYSPDAILAEVDNLEIKQGEIVSIIGKSGIGKTTFLKNIARLVNLNGIAIESRYKFLEAKVASGKLIMKPKPVDTKAIFRVSVIPIYAGEQRKSQLLSHVGYD